MAIYLLPATPTGCCAACPPPGQCTCTSLLPCEDCIPTLEFERDGDCNPIAVDTNGDGVPDTFLEVEYEDCTAPAGTDYATFEADYPEGDGWVILEGCNSCDSACDSDETFFVLENVPEGNNFTVNAAFVALTNTGSASVRMRAWDCLCQGDIGVDSTTLTSSAGVKDVGVVSGTHEVNGTNGAGEPCQPMVEVACDRIPGDCCGWKLAYKVDLFPLPDECCLPADAVGYNTFETDYPEGDGWVHLTSEQITELILLEKTGERLQVGTIPCGTRQSLNIAIASTSLTGITLNAYASTYNCGSCSDDEATASAIGACSGVGEAIPGAEGVVPLYSNGSGKLELDFSAVDDCCAMKIAYQIETLDTSEEDVCGPSNVTESEYCVTDDLGNQIHYVELDVSGLCCIDPSRLSIGFISCSSPDYSVTCAGASDLRIAITPSGGGAFPSPTTVTLEYDLAVAGGADCSCDSAIGGTINDGGDPFTFTATITPAECCTDESGLAAFQAFSCDYGDNDCDNLQRQGTFDGNSCSYS